MIILLCQQYNIEKGIASNRKDIGQENISKYWHRCDNMDALPCFFNCLFGIRVVHAITLHVFTFLVPCSGVR